jgi:hypothetical protein
LGPATVIGVEIRAVLPTDSGMHALWGRDHFPNIVDYDSWEPELLDDEDIERHIRSGHLVPINIHSDGAFAFTMRTDTVATPSLTADERRRVVRESEPYRFVSTGNVDCSGIEYIAGAPPEDGLVATAALDAGEYGAKVFLMDYDDVGDKTDNHPDFIVVIGPLSTANCRLRAEIFGPE